MSDLKRLIWDVPDFPKPGILFRDISPLLRSHFAETIAAMQGLLSHAEWRDVDAVAGIESRGFILAAAMAARAGKGFVPVRKQGKLPPPVVDVPYALEYGTGVLEMQRGLGARGDGRRTAGWRAAADPGGARALSHAAQPRAALSHARAGLLVAGARMAGGAAGSLRRHLWRDRGLAARPRGISRQHSRDLHR